MTERTTRDVIVIGAGHNGLACAAYLARAGRDVLVLEAADEVGGGAATRSFAEGFRVSGCAHLLYQLQPEVAGELELAKFGLETAAADIATTALSPDGEHVVIHGSRLEGRVTERDREGLSDFHDRMMRFAKLLRPYLNRRPPLLVNNDATDKMTIGRLGLDIRRLGRAGMQEFLRLIAINIYDVLNEHLDTELVKGALALDAVLGTHLGPRSPNSLLTYIHRLTGETGGRPGAMALPKGGMGRVGEAFAGAARAAGVDIRCGRAVQHIRVENGRAVGVELAGGDTIAARTVVSNADPKTTVLDLLGPRHVETGFTRRIRNLRMRGNAAKLHLALDGLPDFSGVDRNALGGRLAIAPDMDYVERAFNPAKYGRWSAAPVIEITIPSVSDPSLAPAGRHVLSAVVQYAPSRLEGGWSEERAAAFGDLVIDTIAAYAPDLRKQIIASELLSPADIERIYRMGGGHWHHGELALDQFLFNRPAPGAVQYAMPVEGLYLCGAGTHPGGSITGAAGRNAATEILRREGNS
ncbi:MAG: NAD(P)/FAD-dependent oxidoreductase [Gammaproteobacteria bacterium]